MELHKTVVTHVWPFSAHGPWSNGMGVTTLECFLAPKPARCIERFKVWIDDIPTIACRRDSTITAPYIHGVSQGYMLCSPVNGPPLLEVHWNLHVSHQHGILSGPKTSQLSGMILGVEG